MKNLLWYLFAGTKGGETRSKILIFINETPSNANKISEMLKLDYKTIRHHLEVLGKNGLVTPINKGEYGAVYFVSEIMKADWTVLESIWVRFGKK